MNARLWDLGRGLRSRIQDFFEPSLDTDATPLELLHACLDRVETMVQPAGRDRRVFPYDRLTVTVRQQGADAAAIAAVFDDFDDRLQERLAELRCEPRAVESRVVVEDAPPGDGAPVLSVQGVREQEPKPATHAAVDTYPQVRITVENGTCSAA